MAAPAELVDRTMMLAFEGTRLPPEVRELPAERDVPGFTLFGSLNVEDAPQARALTDQIHAARGGGDRPPPLIAIDQEGGQLMGLGAAGTQFPGNMALGATGDPDLAERVGRATGRELRAIGVTVNYAPVCDVGTDPDNPSLGVRAFGDDPHLVARLAAATVRGLQAEGVASTLKHFPGLGDAAVDPHHALPELDHGLERLEAVELVPFRAGAAAGARLVMVGHCSLPRVTGRTGLPTSLSRRVVHDLLRARLGFDGVVITDALDMKAVAQGGGQAVDVIAALRAGNDLLLCSSDREAQERIRAAVAQGWSRGLLDPADLASSGARVDALRRWVGRFETPGLEEVGAGAHRALAREVAERSVTLVRDEAGVLPLRLRPGTRVAAAMPRPRDLTPADTSSRVAPGLAAALRRHHPNVDEIVTDHPPRRKEIAGLRDRALGCDLVVVGTIAASASPAQATMVAELVSTRIPTVAVALRTPHDLAAYPMASTYVCTYGILPPSMEALAAALWGDIPFRGRLPAAIPGLYPARHGLET